jgi:hypothetical protein
MHRYSTGFCGNILLVFWLCSIDYFCHCSFGALDAWGVDSVDGKFALEFCDGYEFWSGRFSEHYTIMQSCFQNCS